MVTSNFPSRTIGWLLIIIGGVTFLGVVSIILFFTVGGAFGLLNDLANGVEAILSAVLAWRMYPWLRSHAPRLSGFTLIAVVASIAAIIYGDRQVAQGRTPRWLTSFLIGTATFALGAILVAAIRPSDATAGVSTAALAQLPALVSDRNTFNQAELRARVGETVALRLENSDTQVHSFDIDAFDVHVSIPT